MRGALYDAMLALDAQSNGCKVRARLYDVGRRLRDDATNTAQAVSKCYRVLATAPEVEYDPVTGVVVVNLLDPAVFARARRACKARVVRNVRGVLTHIRRTARAGVFYFPSRRRPSITVEVRKREQGVLKGKLDWYLHAHGVSGRPIRSLPELEERL